MLFYVNIQDVDFVRHASGATSAQDPDVPKPSSSGSAGASGSYASRRISRSRRLLRVRGRHAGRWAMLRSVRRFAVDGRSSAINVPSQIHMLLRSFCAGLARRVQPAPAREGSAPACRSGG